MNPIYLLLVISTVIAQLALPRRWGFVPLVFAACHMGSYEVLPELTLSRIVILLGIARAVIGGYFIRPTGSALDKAFYAFTFFALISTFGHKADEYFRNPFISRVGLVFNVFGTYMYGRSYLPDLAAFRRYALIVPLILVPLAIMLAAQKKTGLNYYAYIGISSDQTITREDKIRANGPFKHPILAGCAGATALPLVFVTWYFRRKKTAFFGLAICFAIVVCSASSGPLAGVGISALSILLWRWRSHLRLFLWSLVAFGFFYTIIMGRGPWYLMASLDLVGGSTGWHRAKLMDQGYHYLNEWWLWGSDYTRHWMSTGVRWNPNVVDFTNYYLHLGVTGGLGLMLSLIAMIVIGGRLLTSRMRIMRTNGNTDEIVLWFAGAALATHAISFVSISYFDQMYIFFYLLLGAIPGLVSSVSNPASSSATDNGSHETEKQNEAGPQLFQA